MKKIIILLAVIILFASGCASVPKQGDAAANFTEKEKQDQAVVVNVLDTLLGAGIGLAVGILSGGALSVAMNNGLWPYSYGALFYVPVYAGTAAGGVIGWLLSPKYEEQKKIP